MQSSIYYVCFLALLGLVYCQNPVKIDLYYESYCPYSRDFIANQLLPTFQLVPEIMQVRAVAYGNANETQNSDGSWTFNCQHGPNECEGNMIDSCVFNYYPDQSDWIPFLGCAEAPDDPNSASPQCASDNGLDWDLINTCVGSDLGNQLEHAAAIDTEGLYPEQEYTPWIIINDMHDPKMESFAEYDLMGLVCKLYSGETPAACSSVDRPIQLQRNMVPRQTRLSRHQKH